MSITPSPSLSLTTICCTSTKANTFCTNTCSNKTTNNLWPSVTLTTDTQQSHSPGKPSRCPNVYSLSDSKSSSFKCIRTRQKKEPRRKTSKRIRICKDKWQKNQTKNIPKNYGNAIISFAEDNRPLVRRMVQQFSSIHFFDFLEHLRVHKDQINSIVDLRHFWINPEMPLISKLVRILCNTFFRFHSLKYIFNSRISNFSNHVKYRARLMEALRKPEQFTNIKQF